MDIRFSDEENAFRAEVRAFLQQAWTPELAARIDDDASYPQAIVEWQRRLFERGWVAPGWPKAYGGCEWTPTQRFIYETERSAIGAPDVLPFGLKMVGPVIFKYGNDEQKARFLPRILRGQDWWCQGYSEPGRRLRPGGAEDARRTRRRRLHRQRLEDLDHLRAACRLDVLPGAHRGLGTPAGRHQLPADRHEERRASASARSSPSTASTASTRCSSTTCACRWPTSSASRTRAGPMPSRCWRTSAPPSPASAIPSAASSGCASWRGAKRSGGKPLLDDPLFQARLADIEIDLMALETMELRALFEASKGRGPGAESSLLKIKGTEVQQAIQQLMMDLAGLYGAVLGDSGHDFGNEARRSFMYGRAATIYGGSNEVQKNITAKAVFGL